MAKRKKIYISIPITGFDIEEQKKKANWYKRLLAAKYEVITPFDINQDANEGKPYSYYMGKDIEALLECDAIFLSPGWVDSKGCTAEYEVAKIYGLKIIS